MGQGWVLRRSPSFGLFCQANHRSRWLQQHHPLPIPCPPQTTLQRLSQTIQAVSPNQRSVATIIICQRHINLNIFHMYNLNLSWFVEYVTDLSNYTIIAVKRGFRVYCGNINFTITEQKLQITPSTNNILNTQNESNESNISNISNISNTTNTKTQSPSSFRISQATKSAVSNAISVPNIGMLLRLAEFLNTLDDLSYFVYLNTTYDSTFTYISDLSWGWTHSKWLPPSPIQNFINLNLSSGYEPGWVPFRQPIARFRIKGERMAFLDNCKGFLLYTLPFSLILFVPLWKLYWRFKDYKAAALITPFSSWAYLAVSLICDNGQYLAFRSFEQLRSLQPIGGLFLLSQILAIIVLFIAVFCSFGFFLIAHPIACNSFKPPTLLRFIPSYKFLGIWTSSRLLAGFAHANFDDPQFLISFLLFLQLFLVASTLLSCSCTRFKTPHLALIIGQVTRFVLYSLVCLKVAFPQLAQGKLINLNDLSVFLIQIVFVATASQIVLTIIVGLLVVPQDFELKKKKSNFISPVSSALKSQVEQQKQKVKQKVKQKFKQQVKKNPWIGRRAIKIERNRKIVEDVKKGDINSDIISPLTIQPIKKQVKRSSPKIKQVKNSDLYLIKKYKHQIAIRNMKADQKRRKQIDNERLRM